MTVESRWIGSVGAHYRLPQSELDARSRLDALLRRALDEALDDALARVGIAPGEEICIRSVHAPARLRLAASDTALVADWSAALADALAAAITTGEPHAVRYPSRRQALLDVALATAAGDLSRAWAWRQLGLWPDGEALDAADAAGRLAGVLAAEPHAVVAVLVALARRGALPRLIVLLGTDAWQRLARAALSAAYAPAELIAAPEPGTEEPVGPYESGAAGERARAFVAASALARASLGSGAALGLGPSARRALAVLVALEIDPTALTATRGTTSAAALVGEITAALDIERPDRAASRRAADDRPVDEDPAAAEHAEAEPVDASAAPTDPAAGHPAVDSASTADTCVDTVAAAPPAEEQAELRRAAWTSAAGLLFLLPFAAELDALTDRTLRWTLHQLALALVPELDAADPAALAFAGLGPEELPPSDEHVAATAEEQAAIEAYACLVADYAAEQLDVPGDEDALERVCTRRAEILAEPGWIDVHFSLAELDHDVRRAGLDLDPGWLPRVGIVLRFVYAD
ncbi:MAG TPA: hypothetical protein VFB25_08080 [Gaiellaceae bacterium]|nr:hypothetical protein [Gaiellaceae bacterium]